jgi:tetratricopeptide (TPR) repeat protein
MAAEQAFLKALQLNPERTDARAGMALYLLAPRGELSSAEALLEGDPNPSLELALGLGWIYFWQGRFEETVNQCRRAFKIDSNSAEIYLLLGRAYAAQGQHREALIALGRGQLMAPEDARLLAATSYTHALSGQPKEANRLADDLGAIAQKRYVSMMELALPYAGQGLAEWVDCCIEKAKETHAAALLWWKLDPAWKPFQKAA